MTTTSGNKVLRLLAMVILVTAVLYGAYEARLLFMGPRISIEAPSRPITVTEPYITIKGSASHLTTLSMNGRQIPITENGSFEESIALLPGYNKVVFSASDKNGATENKTIELLYVPRDPIVDPVGSSSAL